MFRAVDRKYHYIRYLSADGGIAGQRCKSSRREPKKSDSGDSVCDEEREPRVDPLEKPPITGHLEVDRHVPYDDQDERYFSDHFIDELKNRDGSVRSGESTPPYIYMSSDEGM